MADTIVNRVAASALITFDLEKLYKIGTRQTIDLSQWLDQDLLLKEKEFRAQLKAHDWGIYKDQFIALHCSRSHFAHMGFLMVTTSKASCP